MEELVLEQPLSGLFESIRNNVMVFCSIDTSLGEVNDISFGLMVDVLEAMDQIFLRQAVHPDQLPLPGFEKNA